MKVKLLSAGLVVALCASAAFADPPKGDKGKKPKDGGDTAQVVTVQALAVPSTDPAGPDRGKKPEKGGDRRR